MTSRAAPLPSRRRLSGALAAVALVAVATFAMAGSPASAQDPSATSVPDTLAPSTTVAVLDTSADNGGATTPTTKPGSAVDQKAVDRENRRLIIIVAALIAVAFALAMMTIRYWRTTRPPARRRDRHARPTRSPEVTDELASIDIEDDGYSEYDDSGEYDEYDEYDEEEDESEEVAAVPARRRNPFETDHPELVRPAAQRPAAPAAAAARPVGQRPNPQQRPNGQGRSKPQQRTNGQARPNPQQRANAPSPANPQPTPRPAAPGRRSRRAIAGADHGGADRDWQPRATGEQETVPAPSATRKARPTRSLRESAFRDRESAFREEDH